MTAKHERFIQPASKAVTLRIAQMVGSSLRLEEIEELARIMAQEDEIKRARYALMQSLADTAFDRMRRGE